MDYNLDELLQHHGVKGMKWGVRKKRESSGVKTAPTVKTQSDSFTFKTKYGDTVTAQGEPQGKLAQFMARHSTKVREEQYKSENLTLKDPKGKTVGDMQLYRESKDSLNVVWVGVDDSHRGKGYAQAAMNGAVSYAKKQGLKKVTLEVPGDSPDAQHIYKKMGFVDKGAVSSDDDVWGGLTKMELDLSDIKHYGVKGMKWGVRKQGTSSPKGPTVKETVKSKTREIGTATKLLNTSKMTSEELQSTVSRIRKENELKRLTKVGITRGSEEGKAKRKLYATREKLSDDELESKLKRLRLEDQLKQEVRNATKESRELANNFIRKSSNFALETFVDEQGRFAPTDNPAVNSVIESTLKEYKKKDKKLLQNSLQSNELLQHYGVKGMKWGVRKDRETSPRKPAKDPLDSVKERALATAYGIGVKVAPRELRYSVQRALNNPTADDSLLANAAQAEAKATGVLSTNPRLSSAIEKVGIEKHKAAKYDLDATDLSRLKSYTDAARYSRNVNSYLATKAPESYKTRAEELKETLSKSKVNDTTVYRSCSMQFSFDGISKKLDSMSESELSKNFNSFSKNYKGKTFKENRVFSTSTSPNFAIDTWRKVNPTAAKSYNTYMIINTKNTPGLLADGRTTSGKKIVSTRSNQEGILAPSKMKYESLAWDAERKMFAITVTAMGDD